MYKVHNQVIKHYLHPHLMHFVSPGVAVPHTTDEGADEHVSNSRRHDMI